MESRMGLDRNVWHHESRGIKIQSQLFGIRSTDHVGEKDEREAVTVSSPGESVTIGARSKKEESGQSSNNNTATRHDSAIKADGFDAS
jgi:hypothetical protein